MSFLKSFELGQKLVFDP